MMGLTARQYRTSLVAWANELFDSPDSYYNRREYGFSAGDPVPVAHAISILEDEIYTPGDTTTFPSGETVTMVETFGGEGMGDQCWYVVKVDDQFFKTTGYYSSWSGTNWEDGDIHEVEPVTVTVTKYRKV